MTKQGAVRRSSRGAGPHRADDSVAGAVPFGERREITALCYDLIGSTKLLAHSDLEDFQDMVTDFQRETGRAVRAHGGLVRESLGDDGGMAFFGFPTPIEDSATAAIRAGLDIIQACRRLAARHQNLHVRIGIATSEVVVREAEGDTEAAVVGFAPTLAARLQTLAPSDTVVVSERTRRLARRYFAFEHLGDHALKGLEEEQAVWSVRRRASGRSRFFASGKFGTRMIGREAELRTALEAWERAVAGDGHVLVIEGEAGIGKSRFVHEVLRKTRGRRARLLLFQCSPRGLDTALAPLIDVIRTNSGLEESGELTAEQVAELMRREGIQDSAAIEMIAFATGAVGHTGAIADVAGHERIRDRMISAMESCIDVWCEKGPIVIAVEDVHWIDPTSKALLQALAERVRTKPVLLLLTGREPPSWIESGAHIREIHLDRLRASEASALVSELWARRKTGAIPPDALSLVYQRTNGVPLFLEEIAQWLASTSSAESRDWMSLLSHARSSSFENLLAARLGSLGPAKSVAQAASVIGREFDEKLLSAIVPDVTGESLSVAIAELVRANILVWQEVRGVAGYAFRHSLIQETLYKALLRAASISLHRKVYEAAVNMPEVRTTMSAATLAEHADRAGFHKEAASNYIAAAKESSARSAMVEARNLLQRALEIIGNIAQGDDHDRLELAALAALGPVLTSTEGTKSPAACDLYERAVAIARRRPAHEQADWFPIYWGWWYTGADFAIQRERAQAVIADLRGVDEPEVQLQAQHCVWAIDFNMGRHETCIAAVDAGLALYQSGKGRESLTLFGGHDPRVCGLGQKGLSLWFKGLPNQAVACVEESVRSARQIGHAGSLAHAYDIAAMLYRYRGDLNSLRKTIAAMRRLARKHELHSLAAKALIFDGWRIAKLGNPARGRKSAEAGFAIQREIGTREDFPVYSEMLAEILALLSETDAAIGLLDEAVEEAERTGHLYWLPELHRRRALLNAQRGAAVEETVASLDRALRLALEQNATTLFLGACETALALGVWERVDPALRAAVRPAIASVEQEGEMATLVASIVGMLDRSGGS